MIRKREGYHPRGVDGIFFQEWLSFCEVREYVEITLGVKCRLDIKAKSTQNQYTHDENSIDEDLGKF